MKVRYVRPVNSAAGHSQNDNSWLTIGSVYIVLAVFFDDQSGLQFRLIGDDHMTPALHEASQFDLVTDVIPTNWSVTLDRGVFELGPKKWNAKGFWQRYFDRDSTAIRMFEQELRIIWAAEQAATEGDKPSKSSK
jgi:hypothetical protein